MSRRVLLAAAGVCVALVLGLASYAAEPTTCAFPAALDTFQSVAPRSTWNAFDHNRILCAINALQRRAKKSGELEHVCQAVNIPAATRQLVNVTLATSVTGTEPVFAAVVDTTNPARLAVDAIQGLGGTTATVAVFNHDASSARTGRLCVSVVRS